MTFGPYDFVHLYEAPNDEAMAKFVMTLASFGNIRTTLMRVLCTPFGRTGSLVALSTETKKLSGREKFQA